MKLTVKRDELRKAAKENVRFIIYMTDVKGHRKILAIHDDAKEAHEHIKKYKKMFGESAKVDVEKRAGQKTAQRTSYRSDIV